MRCASVKVSRRLSTIFTPLRAGAWSKERNWGGWRCWFLGLLPLFFLYSALVVFPLARSRVVVGSRAVTISRELSEVDIFSSCQLSLLHYCFLAFFLFCLVIIWFAVLARWSHSLVIWIPKQLASSTDHGSSLGKWWAGWPISPRAMVLRNAASDSMVDNCYRGHVGIGSVSYFDAFSAVL